MQNLPKLQSHIVSAYVTHVGPRVDRTHVSTVNKDAYSRARHGSTVNKDAHSRARNGNSIQCTVGQANGVANQRTRHGSASVSRSDPRANTLPDTRADSDNKPVANTLPNHWTNGTVRRCEPFKLSHLGGKRILR